MSSQVINVIMPDGSIIEYVPMPPEVCNLVLSMLREENVRLSAVTMVSSLLALLDLMCANNPLHWEDFVNEAESSFKEWFEDNGRELKETLLHGGPRVLRDSAYVITLSRALGIRYSPITEH